jgi:hypothetical protein
MREYQGREWVYTFVTGKYRKVQILSWDKATGDYMVKGRYGRILHRSARELSPTITDLFEDNATVSVVIRNKIKEREEMDENLFSLLMTHLGQIAGLSGTQPIK